MYEISLERSLFSDQTAWWAEYGESTTFPTCSRLIQTGKHSLCKNFLYVAISASATEDNSCQAVGLKTFMTLKQFSKYLLILTFRLRWFQAMRQQGSTEALQGSSVWVHGRDAGKPYISAFHSRSTRYTHRDQSGSFLTNHSKYLGQKTACYHSRVVQFNSSQNQCEFLP